MPTNDAIAKYVKSLANSERALGALGSELAPVVANILDVIATLMFAGMAPTDVVIRLKDLSADLAVARADIQKKADEKFSGESK